MTQYKRTTHPMRSLSGHWIVTLALVCLFLCSGKLQAEETSQNTDRTASQMLADQWVVLARIALGTQGEVRAEQLAMASVLMDQALQLDPADVENWRLRWELARQMNDAPAIKIALRQYCQLVPDDDQAQYAWIMTRLADLDTIPDRIAASERLLTGKAAGQFSPAMRSKLATYVAGACGEIGDMPRMFQWLKTASALDSSNSDAARMVYQTLLARQRPANEIGAALIKVIEAQPFDAQWRTALADLLAMQAAYRQAAVQYRNAQVLGRTVQNPVELYPWVLCLAVSGRTEEAMKLLDDIEVGWNSQKSPPAPAPAPGTSGNTAATTQPTQPAPLTGQGLPTDLRILRLAILRGTGKLTTMETGLDQLLPTPGTPSATLPATTEPTEKTTAADLLPADIAWLQLLFDRQIPQAQAWIQQAQADASLDVPLLNRMRGWLALRQKQPAAARELLQPLASKDVFAALGLALTMTSAAEAPARMELLQKIIASAPVSLAAYLSQQAWTQAGFTASTMTPEGEGLSKAVDRWPAWMIWPNPRNTPVLQVSLHIENTRLGFLEPITGWVGVRNLTDVPMAILPAGPVPSTGVLAFSAKRMPDDQKFLPPMVLDAGRRIRIEPRTEFRIPVRVDRSQAGIVFANRAFDSFAFSTTAIIGPIFDGKSFRVGSLGACDSVTLVDRRGQGSTIAILDNIAKNLGGSETPELFTSMATLLRALPRLCAGPDAAKDPEAARRIAEAISQRFSVGSPLLQAWTIRFLPTEAPTIPLLQSIHDVAVRSKDPIIGVGYLAVMVHDPDSPQLDAAIRSGDEKLGQFAKALRGNLKSAK